MNFFRGTKEDRRMIVFIVVEFFVVVEMFVKVSY